MVFPELGLSAYSADDLFLQDALLDSVERELAWLVEQTATLFPVFVVGAPVRRGGSLYNAAVVIAHGRILGVVPKCFLPNYREFYEKRHFASGLGVKNASIRLAGQTAPFGTDLLFESTGDVPFRFHAEICEDVWVAEPPSGRAALAGAEILLNLSASNITIGKANARRLLCGAQSMRCQAAYAYSAAGPGESTTDLAWDGQAAIFELGENLGETRRFPKGGDMIVRDVDLGRIRQERRRSSSFADSAAALSAGSETRFRICEFVIDAPQEALPLRRHIERFPYVPSDPRRLSEDCFEAYEIQVQGLAQRLASSGIKKLVIGVSGGLDSTQALIVCTRVMDDLGLSRSNILAYTMPGFGTSDKTKGNAWALMRALGVTPAELDIRPAAKLVLADIGHPYAEGAASYDVTFENVQAGLRTDYLFRLANHHGALVVGTGDLSESALGWCTYGVGDHMSHYNPNASLSKTLIQHLIRFIARSGDLGAETSSILESILNTEISPELVPSADGATQRTEDFVGPYPLQDFNLFYLTRYGFRPSKIAYLAWHAWSDIEQGVWPANVTDRQAYDLKQIKRWLTLFLGRFFQNQFKRSCVPNGPKISSGGSLSPRGDWRAPSDASATVWLQDLENVPEQMPRTSFPGAPA